MFESIKNMVTWSERMLCMGSHDNPCPKCDSVGTKVVQFKKGDMAKYTCDCGHKWLKQWKVGEEKTKIKM
jgi:lysyl-tRNA synthetase class I